jgi:flagellar biosynthesis protein FliR
MISIQLTDMTMLTAFWLAFTRWMSIIIQLPLFDNTTVPPMVRVLSSLVITYAFFPYLSDTILKDIHYIGADNFWYLTVFYALVGLMIGFLVKSIMNIFIASGSIITQQVGFGAVRYFDPTSSSQIGPFEKLIQWTVLVLILTSGALFPMFNGVFNSFFSIHTYDLGSLSQITTFFTGFFKSIFISAVMLASPLIFINVLIMSVLGVIARTVPQMNIIMVSFVVNIGMGLLVFISTSNEFFTVAYNMYIEKLGDWFQFII